MTNYRRYPVPGGTVFFPVKLAERSKHLLVEPIDRLREAFRLVKTELPFEIDAIVILPEHLHALWTLPIDDMDYSIRWKRIKREFSCRFPNTERRSASRRLKGERGIWQRRFWEHVIRDENDYDRHFDYIYYNPENTAGLNVSGTGHIPAFMAMSERSLSDQLGWNPYRLSGHRARGREFTGIGDGLREYAPPILPG